MESQKTRDSEKSLVPLLQATLFFVVVVVFCLFETGSPFSPSWPVVQAGLELTEIRLSPKC